MIIWGYITSEGSGEIVFVDGSMNSQRYCQAMENVMLRLVTGLLRENFILQQDNAPCHKSRVTIAGFAEHDVELLP